MCPYWGRYDGWSKKPQTHLEIYFATVGNYSSIIIRIFYRRYINCGSQERYFSPPPTYSVGKCALVFLWSLKHCRKHQQCGKRFEYLSWISQMQNSPCGCGGRRGSSRSTLPSRVLWSRTSWQAVTLSLCRLWHTNPFLKSKTRECYNSERLWPFFHY